MRALLLTTLFLSCLSPARGDIIFVLSETASGGTLIEWSASGTASEALTTEVAFAFSTFLDGGGSAIPGYISGPISPTRFADVGFSGSLINTTTGDSALVSGFGLDPDDNAGGDADDMVILMSGTSVAFSAGDGWTFSGSAEWSVGLVPFATDITGVTVTNDAGSPAATTLMGSATLVVPEPSCGALGLAGLLVVAARRRRTAPSA